MIYSFAVPPELQASLAIGKVIRRGALLINANGGGIVAHLQETAALSKMAGAFSNPLTMASSIGSLATGSINVLQNEQIKRRIDVMQEMLGTAQGLQIATLATSMAAIGVSAAGTALVCKRIDDLCKDLDRLESTVTSFRDEWRTAELQGLLEKAMTRVERIDSARKRGDGRPVLQEAEQVLHDVFDAMVGRGNTLFARQALPVDALRIILDGISISGSARIKALFILDEPESAKDTALRQLAKLGEMTMSMPADRLIGKLQGTEAAKDIAKQVMVTMSETRNRLASVPSLIDHLASIDLKPSAYLAAAEEEGEAPLMISTVIESIRA